MQLFPRLRLSSLSLPSAALVCLLAALLVLISAPLGADVITMKNGRTMEGTVTVLEDGRIQLDASFGTMIFSAKNVERIQRADSLESTVWSALNALPEDDVAGRLAIADWVEGYGNHTLARQVRDNTVDLAPESTEARAAIGQQQVDGRWMTEEEYRASRRQVRYGDRWVSRDEARELAVRDEGLRLVRRQQGLMQQQINLDRERLDLLYRTFDSPDDEGNLSHDGYAAQPVQSYGLPGLDPLGLAPEAIFPQGAGVFGGLLPGYFQAPGQRHPPIPQRMPQDTPRNAPQTQRAPGVAPPQQRPLTGPRNNRGGFSAPSGNGK
ncbi:MAG: hypothetical protein AAGD01_04755 [Acidobacteriota bacterium]